MAANPRFQAHIIAAQRISINAPQIQISTSTIFQCLLAGRYFATLPLLPQKEKMRPRAHPLRFIGTDISQHSLIAGGLLNQLFRV